MRFARESLDGGGKKMEPQKKFYVALAVYAVLGLLIWITMSDVPVAVGGVALSIRRLTLGILALFVARTVLHWRAEQIRHERSEKEEVSG